MGGQRGAGCGRAQTYATCASGPSGIAPCMGPPELIEPLRFDPRFAGGGPEPIAGVTPGTGSIATGALAARSS